MEVVVVFEGGDPDKPLVIGSVPNGTHPPPFVLPGDKTRSGIRTQSSPGGGGFNEISFEDAAGREQVFLRAQRDLDEVIGREHTTTVAQSQRVTVGANRTESIQLDQIERVGGRRVESVAGNHEEEIGKDRRTTIHGSDTETVEKGRTTSVGGDLHEQVTGHHVSSVGTHQQPKQRDSFAWGKYVIGSDLVLDLSARNGVRLRCGESMIELTKEGIELKADTIVISAKKALNASGKGPKLILGDEAQLVSKTIRFFSSKASLLLGDEAHLDGDKVKLNCQGVDPDAADASGQPARTKRFSLKLSDGDFASLAGKDYVLVTGGVKFEGKTSGEGVVEHDIPDDADVAALTVWIEDRPEGRSVQYRVKLGALEDSSVVSGAQARLKNLGYYAGSFGDVLDADTRAALKDFQVDHQLEATGELDAGTVQKLSDVHGH
jgi:type VI secretion system secreted protein VgrG